MAPSKANDAQIVSTLRLFVNSESSQAAATLIEQQAKQIDALAAVIKAAKNVPQPLDGNWFDYAMNVALVLASNGDAEKILAAHDAKVLRDAADAMDLPGSQATGYYAGESDAGYREATRDAGKWFKDYADRIEGGTQ